MAGNPLTNCLLVFFGAGIGGVQNSLRQSGAKPEGDPGQNFFKNKTRSRLVSNQSRLRQTAHAVFSGPSQTVPMKQFLAFFLLVSAQPLLLLAEPVVALRTDASPREITIGDPIKFSIVVSVSSEVAHIPFSWTEEISNFEALTASSPTARIENDGKTTTMYQFILTTFSTGTQMIPSLPLRFTTLQGQLSEAKTQEIPIQVKSILAEKGDEGNIRPLKGMFNFKSYWGVWILLVLAALAGGAYSFWRWQRKRTIARHGEASGPPRPPEELAREAIMELEQSNLIESGQTKEFYFRLSVILRTYLEQRYGWSALDRTTSELLMELRTQKFDLTLVNICRSFLDNADLVKFAKFTPDNEDIVKDLNQVKEFVSLTTPSVATKGETVEI